jgi:hypothetical protein
MLWSLSALADCREEALDAFSRIETSGPFHYVIVDGSQGSIDEMGELIPGKAQFKREYYPTNSSVEEHIHIGDLTWENDGFGWMEPSGSTSAGYSIVSFQGEVVSAKCPTREMVGHRVLKKYELGVIRKWSAVFTNYRLFTDPSTGLAARLESGLRSGKSPVTIITFEYDDGIEISPPVVIDRSQRWQNSMQKFHEAIERSDPECRKDALETIRRSVSSRPFQYEIANFRSTAFYGRKGVAIPPDAIHDYLTTGHYSYVTIETVVIGSEKWQRREGETWEASDKRTTEHLNLLLESIVPNTDFIGEIQCFRKSNRPHNIYLFEMYFDWEWRSVRIMHSSYKMYVQKKSNLIEKIEYMDEFGNIFGSQTHKYVDGLVVEQPQNPDID